MLTALALHFAMSQTSPLSLTIHLDRARQTIDNFGASDCWTVESLMRWPEERRKEIAQLLFDREKGAGLSGWRFNVGGGIDHEAINNPMRTADTFEVAEGKYDWTRCPGQRWFLQAAADYRVPTVVIFANSPPRRLTRNGHTNGADGQGSTNLAPGAEAAFAKYLADVADHFATKGVHVTHVSPINEPDWEWNKGSQEGNRASNADLLAMNLALARELERRNSTARILTPEATQPQKGYQSNGGMARKYGSEYGSYAKWFAREREATRTIRPIFGYHDYGSDRLDAIVPIRQKLRQALDAAPPMEVWQTEYCQMDGPRGEGGWGRDLGMTLAINVARLIHFDLTIVEASAWQWWLSVSDSDYKDGLVYVDDLDREDGFVLPSKTLWAIGQWSRFVRPGFQRVELEGSTPHPNDLLASAYRDPKSGRLVVVFVNPLGATREANVTTGAKWKAKAYRTSDLPGENVKDVGRADLTRPLAIPPRSIVTVVADPA